jgi:hypothetical protein
MLSKQRCPYTGIVNYFTSTDPLLSVGSIVKAGEQRLEYHWRWYDAAERIAGIAADMQTAEERLKSHYRRAKARESLHAA